jgi:hypothetical protein
MTQLSIEQLQSMGDCIRLQDTEIVDGDIISLFHYRRCDEESNDLVKQARGVVFANNKLVMMGFPFTPEYVISPEDNTSKIEKVFSGSRFFDSFEGTIIRVFFHKKWFVSTPKRLDASTSRWGSEETFESIFHNAIDTIGQNNGKFNYDTFFDTLNKDNQYMFLLRSTKNNRIVSRPELTPEIPPVFHVGTYINGIYNIDDDVSVPRPRELKFETPDAIKSFILSLNPHIFQGVFVTGEHGFHKFVSSAYHMLSCVRGNEPNLVKRYLELRSNKEEHQKFFYLYGSFESVEVNLLRIARNIHSVYMKRFIAKEYAVVDPTRYGVLKKCHSLYMQNRAPVTLTTVINVLNTETPDNLYRMITC